MPLDLSNFVSSGTGYMRYKPQTGTFETRGEPFPFTQAVFDLDQIKTGWGLIQRGQAPEWVYDDSIEKRAPKPTSEGDWRRGFTVDVYSRVMFGDEEPVKTWSTNTAGANKGIAALYAEWEKSKEPNKLPVVEFVGTTEHYGNSRVPNFKIVKYVDRPAALSPAPASSPKAGQQEAADDIEFI
jgi:hypothetical protein